MPLASRIFASLACIVGFGLLTGRTDTFVGAAAPIAPGPYANQVVQLRATVHLLQQANHDYQGHRAKAVREIHVAIHMLHPGHHKHHQPTVKSAGNNEPQSVSDAQLRQARAQLQAIRGQLPSQVQLPVASAIRELEIALAIR